MDPAFEWPNLLLQIEASPRPQGRVRLGFRGVLEGKEPRDFGHVEIQDPSLYINQVAQLLDQWADPEQSRDIQSLTSHLVGLGIQLFRALIPPKLQEYYWTKLHPACGSTMLVVADGAGAITLPWEIIKPGEEEPFWCEHLCMSRWLSECAIAQSLPGQSVACVLADPGLGDVSEPARRLLNATSEVVTWEELEALLRTEGIGIFHWTGHGEPCADTPSFSKLPIGGETFRPVDLLLPKHQRFLSTHPWVFLHACSTTHTAGALIGLGGWPHDLIQGGAGAVLGTAWDVRTSTAIPFVECLYESILSGERVGAAVRQARKRARRDGDPSWLAYQLYAHPEARVLRDSHAGRRTNDSIKLIVQRACGVVEDLGWRRDYLQQVANQSVQTHEVFVPLAGTAQASEVLEYSTIYVEPATPGDPVMSHSFTNIVDAIQEYEAVVLLGQSGSGKTATMHKIRRKLARSALAGEAGIQTPILVCLDEYSTDDQPLDYIRKRCRGELRQRLEAEFDEKRIFLLCDGLNELSRQDYMRKIKAWRELIEKYPGNRFVFACRTSWYQDELHLQKMEISPLDDERIVRSLFAAVGEKADSLWKALQSGGLLDLARMPLFLKWILQSYRGSGDRLPQNRSLLLKGLLTTFFKRETEKGLYETLPFEKLTSAMSEFAYAMHSGISDGAILRTRAESILNDLVADEDTGNFVPEALAFALTVGILKESDHKLRFRDPQFRDYYAGVALAARFAKGADMRQYCQPANSVDRESATPDYSQKLSPPPTTDWEDAVIVASGLLADGAAFLTEVCAVNPRLAGECLSRNRPRVGSETTVMVQENLFRVATDSATPFPERVASAATLGRVGDPRFKIVKDAFGISYIPPELVRIPAGTVLLGSADFDDLAFNDERPQHQLEVAAFGIGRYPVTNAEFQLFVDGGGYKAARYWTEAGWLWRNTRETGEGSVGRSVRNLAYFREHRDDMERWFEEAQLSRSDQEFWRSLLPLEDREARARLFELGFGTPRSRDLPPFQQDHRYSGATQPVVGVTWYEAMAYCAWLREMSGQRFMLPSELQWERAAKGDAPLVYPWGPIWQADRCNSLSVRLLQPSPVGVFPAGRSLFGCDDMVGNVFEWTTTIYRSYPYDPFDGREDISADEVRVNRGGGWDSTKRVTRCALRGDMCQPHTYDRNLGFRVSIPDIEAQ